MVPAQLAQCFTATAACFLSRRDRFHIVVGTYAGVQTIPDKQLAAIGAKRNSRIRVRYYVVALRWLPSTELVASLAHDVGGQGGSKAASRESAGGTARDRKSVV